ncbi:hypothetical protein [Ruminococcus sp.]|uniref:hypothetical protein n=1 Tax=Ruminococcus sp. TaxID=41978 RepID=UPI002E80B98F|nr:hypothetical protein [Ruminococcus sp.]MEE3439927.1 hypothetical protein [Ruminococcus sp.]
MAVYLGNNKLTFDGISEIYVGSNKVYSATPPGPPIIDNPVNEYFCVYSANSFTIRFEKIQTAGGANANLNYDNLKLKYSTNKTNWTEVSAAQGFNFNGGTLYYIYTSSAEVGTFVHDSSLSWSSAAWGQVCSAPAYGYYSYTSTRMKFSGTSTIYLMGNIRTIAQGDQATPYNSYVGSSTMIDYVGMTVSSSSYSIYYTRACGLGASTRGSTYLRARGISNIQGTSNSIIDISNLFIGNHENTGTGEVSYPTFSYSTGTPYLSPTDMYFYVENLTNSANTLTIKKSNSSNSPTITVYYSTDQTTWTSMGSTSTTGITYSIPANSKVYLKATAANWAKKVNYSTYANMMSCSSSFAVGGNIMSLIKGDSFSSDYSFTAEYALYNLFYGSTNLMNIDKLVLPSKLLQNYCYFQMFHSCTGLTSIPSNLLPATTLAQYCYGSMFSGCSGLTSIPSNLLPATTLGVNCYALMFLNCTSLTTVPEDLLPATTLANNCYYGMFQNTRITKSPELPATTLTQGCYRQMFYDCSSLNEITCSANDISASNCTYSWTKNVSSSGTFHKKGTANWTLNSVDGVPTGWTVDVDPITDYFYVENLTSSANTLSIKKSDESAPTITIYRSTDKNSWTSMGSTSTTALTYSIPANSKIYLKATANNWGTPAYYNNIICSNNFAVGGNIMSLLYGDSFTGKTVFPSSSSTSILFRLFNNSTNLKNIDNLVLPATTLNNYCYGYMFGGCTGLTTLPSNLLPATTLNNQCYSGMFYNCTGLTTVPSNFLPATTLTDNCYRGMFQMCTGLTNVPNLPATTLASNCYDNMFSSCRGLTSIPSTLLPATTLAQYCYSSMFSGCTSLINVPNLPATTLAGSCYSSMFSGCTNLTNVPNLPATTLAGSCYSSMFSRCTSLTKAPELPAPTLVSTCYRSMFNNCSSLNEITCYANNISATNCTTNWTTGVASSGTFHKKGTASWTTGSNGIPSGWTVVNT